MANFIAALKPKPQTVQKAKPGKPKPQSLVELVKLGHPQLDACQCGDSCKEVLLGPSFRATPPPRPEPN